MANFGKQMRATDPQSSKVSFGLFDFSLLSHTHKVHHMIKYTAHTSKRQWSRRVHYFWALPGTIPASSDPLRVFCAFCIHVRCSLRLLRGVGWAITAPKPKPPHPAKSQKQIGRTGFLQLHSTPIVAGKYPTPQHTPGSHSIPQWFLTSVSPASAPKSLAVAPPGALRMASQDKRVTWFVVIMGAGMFLLIYLQNQALRRRVSQRICASAILFCLLHCCVELRTPGLVI